MGVEHSPSSIAINHGSYIPGNPKVTNRINEILSPRVYEVRENDDWNKVSRGLSLSESATNFLNINFGANKVTQMKWEKIAYDPTTQTIILIHEWTSSSMIPLPQSAYPQNTI